jgi:4-carboxymuconolactone decarboxylase
MPPRYTDFTPDTMTPEQKRVYDEIVAGPRGRIYGPFLVLMHNPGLASAVQKMGAYVRWSSTVPERLKELAICCIGRFWGAHVEWATHSAFAVKAGIDPAVIEALEAGRGPAFKNDDEATIYDFCMTLLEKKGVDDALYARCLAVLGERGLIDLMATFTHYSTVSMTLNTFHREHDAQHVPGAGARGLQVSAVPTRACAAGRRLIWPGSIP